MATSYISRFLRGVKTYPLSRRSFSISSSSKQINPVATEDSPENVPPNIVTRMDPLQHPDYFGVHKLFTVKDLFDAKVYFGHKEGSLDDRMRQFIFGNRLGQLIIDLDHTAEHLRHALNFSAHIAFRKGVILFVSRHQQTALTVERTALECGEFAHTRTWPDGTFTNISMFYGTETRLPDLLIFLHTLETSFEQHAAVRDCAKLLIPSVGIVDTNCNPNLITYPVPGNDDTPRAIELYCRLFKEAILLGKNKRKEVDGDNLN